jgi:hypothetical protein
MTLRSQLYNKFFEQAQELTSKLQNIESSVIETDRELSSDFAGFTAIFYCSMVENAAREIFCDFGRSCHHALLHWISQETERMNSKISIDDLRSFCGRFGKSYSEAFTEYIKEEEEKLSGTSHVPLRASYKNLLLWRHAYAHSGEKKATLRDVAQTLSACRHVIYALDKTLR